MWSHRLAAENYNQVKIFYLCKKSLYADETVQDALSIRGAGAMGATALIAQTVRGQHGSNRLPFLPELHFEICALFTGMEFITIFKQFCTFSTVQQIQLFKINVEVCRPIIATSNRVSIQ